MDRWAAGSKDDVTVLLLEVAADSVFLTTVSYYSANMNNLVAIIMM